MDEQNLSAPTQAPQTTSPISPQAPSPSPWESVAKAWESLATRVTSLQPQVPVLPAQPTPSETSSEASGATDEVVQAWADQGISTQDINNYLADIPYVLQIPELGGDMALVGELIADPNFQANKGDPQYMANLRQSLRDQGFNSDNLPSSNYPEPGETLTYPPNFGTWGNQTIPAFYQQDQLALGRMLAEAGGDFDPGAYR